MDTGYYYGLNDEPYPLTLHRPLAARQRAYDSVLLLFAELQVGTVRQGHALPLLRSARGPDGTSVRPWRSWLVRGLRAAGRYGLNPETDVRHPDESAQAQGGRYIIPRLRFGLGLAASSWARL